MDANLLSKYDRRIPRYTSYPTAPHFHPGVDGRSYARWLTALPAEAPLSLYLHIPYCDSLCWFCGCHTKIVRRYQPVADYLGVLNREVDLIGDLLGPGRTLAHLHFGGGTPTILQSADVTALGDHLARRFRFSDATEFAVEIDPREVEQTAIEAWAAIGANRASLGVQDVNPEVQAAINRRQPIEVTARVVEWLRAAGVRSINLDLMYGLPLQTIERVLATVDTAVALAPDRLALFGYAHVPWMKRHQRMIQEASLPTADERLRQSEAAAARLVEAGYVQVGLDHFARPDDPLARAAAGGGLHRNFQGYTTDAAGALIGLGASAIGALPQGYAQNAAPLRDYAEAIIAGRPATVRGLALSDDDRVRRSVIERLMCGLSVDLDVECRRFARDVGGFATELQRLRALEADGLVRIDGHRLQVPVEARPLLRAVCAVFDSYLGSGTGRHAQAV